ncbi:hypothetical protein J7T55_000566 [Diaporthe amygdali]|uniref:uncharacterized protein n=1 Tax=Phomopsis amygdali TaxID=1214568 RepID=UPI0022FE429F|nr:uncharacterized protein J7T55_000566 [Diaporthe amygdali]KAJ0110134.1 hypothetical protein J7T55_000566 [Diaporthe amygdali]
MSSHSLQPSETKQSDNVDWSARAATLKQQLMERRQQAASAQSQNMNFSQRGSSGQFQQRKKPVSGGVEPVQPTTTAQGQTFLSLSNGFPDVLDAHKEASRSKKLPKMAESDESGTHDSIQRSQAVTQKLMEGLSPRGPSTLMVQEKGDKMAAVNETELISNRPSRANDHTGAKVQEKLADGDNSKIQPRDGYTAEDTNASRSETRTALAPKEKSNMRSTTEDGEITRKHSPALHKIPVRESTTQPATRKKTPPTRASTVTSIVPTEPRAERHVSRSVDPTSVSKQREFRGDTAAGHSSAPRSDNKHGHGRRSLPDRPRVNMPEHDNTMTWEAYKAAPARHIYAQPNREPRPHSVSPAAARPARDDSDWEVERFAFEHPDLRDWLYYTGWNSSTFRRHELSRLRRMEEIECERYELMQERERETAELNGAGEPASKARRLIDTGPLPLSLDPAPPRRAEDVQPAEYRMLGRYTVTAGIKRERGEQSDGDRDYGSSAKFYRTDHNYRGSRAGYHGSYDRGRDEPRYWHDQEARPRSEKNPPHGLAESSPPRTLLPQRYSRYRYSSPIGHPLPRDELDAERAANRHVTRDRQRSHRRSERSMSPQPRGRGFKAPRSHKPEYGRL